MPLMDGKVALITGAARGQGRSHALTLAREGADVVLIDVAAQIETVPYPLATPEELAETVRQVEALDRRALAFEADVRDQAALDAAVVASVEELGRIDVVVTNAGIWSIAEFWKLTDEEWADNIDVNLTGHWRTLKAVAPHMIERGDGGSIIMVSSVNGVEAGPGYAHYCAAKAGVLQLMRNVAMELGPYDVRCNAICPGALDTSMNTWQGALDMMGGKPGSTLEDRAQVGKHWSLLPGRSFLDPSATSNAVLWLASDQAADITGVVIPVDAGHLVSPGFNHQPA